MANIEEKIKAFLSDEEKMEALGNDSAFMEKVSGGTATTQDIAEKFGELGLELTPDEAKAVGKTATAILNTPPIAQLGDESLDTISGGTNWINVASTAGFATGAAGTAGALGCNVARLVCDYKAKNAALNGNIKLSRKYTDHATALKKVSMACAIMGATGFQLGFGLKLASHKIGRPPTQVSVEEPADNISADNNAIDIGEWHDNPIFNNPLYEGDD